jgi:hypothetical protein
MAQPACVELNFRPNAHLVTVVRRFVSEFYQRAVARIRMRNRAVPEHIAEVVVTGDLVELEATTSMHEGTP